MATTPAPTTSPRSAMAERNSVGMRPDAALCPRCTSEQARIYRPGAPEDQPRIMGR
jgi:hypothetical protein